MSHDVEDPEDVMAECRRCGRLGALAEIREHVLEHDKIYNHADRHIDLFYGGEGE